MDILGSVRIVAFKSFGHLKFTLFNSPSDLPSQFSKVRGSIDYAWISSLQVSWGSCNFQAQGTKIRGEVDLLTHYHHCQQVEGKKDAHSSQVMREKNIASAGAETGPQRHGPIHHPKRRIAVHLFFFSSARAVAADSNFSRACSLNLVSLREYT
jgi:hypothetical protein